METLHKIKKNQQEAGKRMEVMEYWKDGIMSKQFATYLLNSANRSAFHPEIPF